jgi:hypothetical protein
MFHEGNDPAAATGFREIARVTGGAYVRFDQNAASELASAAARGGRLCHWRTARSWKNPVGLRSADCCSSNAADQRAAGAE